MYKVQFVKKNPTFPFTFDYFYTIYQSMISVYVCMHVCVRVYVYVYFYIQFVGNNRLRLSLAQQRTHSIIMISFVYSLFKYINMTNRSLH